MAAGRRVAVPQPFDGALEADGAARRADGAEHKVDDVVAISIVSGSCSTTGTVWPLSRSRSSRSFIRWMSWGVQTSGRLVSKT